MQILVACEESQTLTIELRRLGHKAYSCDVEPCSGGHPEWHIQADVLPLTVDEMRKIVLGGKDNAVWIQPTYWFSNGHAYRALLDLFQDHIIALDTRSMTNGIDDEVFDEYNYGKTWFAYAREPKGEATT